MDYWQIFTLVTGVLYVVFEVRQKNIMWLVGIATSFASMWVFFREANYASFSLNTYYLITSFIGFWHWQRDKANFKATHTLASEDVVVLNRLTRKTIIISAVVALVGTFLLSWSMTKLYALGWLNENPFSLLDSGVTMLSAVATWWLVRSYKEQWWLWVVADSLTVVLCALQKLWWLSALYVVYVLASSYGLYYWHKYGAYGENQTDLQDGTLAKS